MAAALDVLDCLVIHLVVRMINDFDQADMGNPDEDLTCAAPLMLSELPDTAPTPWRRCLLCSDMSGQVGGLGSGMGWSG